MARSSGGEFGSGVGATLAQEHGIARVCRGRVRGDGRGWSRAIPFTIMCAHSSRPLLAPVHPTRRQRTMCGQPAGTFTVSPAYCQMMRSADGLLPALAHSSSSRLRVVTEWAGRGGCNMHAAVSLLVSLECGCRCCAAWLSLVHAGTPGHVAVGTQARRATNNSPQLVRAPVTPSRCQSYLTRPANMRLHLSMWAARLT